MDDDAQRAQEFQQKQIQIRIRRRPFAHDLARNWIISADHVDLIVTEIPDEVKPLVAYAEIHLDNGTVFIWMTETLRLVPNSLMNSTLIRFSNLAETHGFSHIL